MLRKPHVGAEGGRLGRGGDAEEGNGQLVPTTSSFAPASRPLFLQEPGVQSTLSDQPKGPLGSTVLPTALTPQANSRAGRN